MDVTDALFVNFQWKTLWNWLFWHSNFLASVILSSNAQPIRLAVESTVSKLHSLELNKNNSRVSKFPPHSLGAAKWLVCTARCEPEVSHSPDVERGRREFSAKRQHFIRFVPVGSWFVRCLRYEFLVFYELYACSKHTSQWFSVFDVYKIHTTCNAAHSYHKISVRVFHPFGSARHRHRLVCIIIWRCWQTI